MKVPVVIQYRHVHLSSEDRGVLFGDMDLGSEQVIEHRGQFVSKERVQVIGPAGIFEKVCVIGPERSVTQVELSASDAHSIGVKAPLRISGDLDRSATVTLKGPHGQVEAKMSTIIPIRHMHLPTALANENELAQGDVVSVRLGEKTIDHIIVRVHPTFAPAVHVSIDEAAELWLQPGDTVIL
ncbi:MAG: propanediol utilization protein [Parcubacteria group bacterium]|nr:propanediol utilization protein [Parcubacteria group bacterium]